VLGGATLAVFRVGGSSVAHIVEIAPGVHRVALLGTNVYLVRSANSVVLIDAGYPGCARANGTEEQSRKRGAGSSAEPAGVDPESSLRRGPDRRGG
jgi:hypothetical protein